MLKEQAQAARARAREAALEELRVQQQRQREAEEAEQKRKEHEEWLLYGKGQYSEEERAIRIANKVRVQYNWTDANKATIPAWCDWREIACTEHQWFLAHKSTLLLRLLTDKCQAFYAAINRSPGILDMDLENYLDHYFDELQTACQSWRRTTLHGKITNREQRVFLRDVAKVVKYVFGNKDPYRNLISLAEGMRDHPIRCPMNWEFMEGDNDFELDDN